MRRGTLAAAVGMALLPGVVLASVYGAPPGDSAPRHRQPIRSVEWTQEELDPAEIFKRQCVACHGKKGEGDGPAAAAMNPRPADLTDPERIGDRTDDELVDVLTNGKGAMPSFGSLLDSEEIKAMVGYIRELSGTESEP